jgi:hypothetical protein
MAIEHYLYKVAAVYQDDRTAAAAMGALDAADLDAVMVIELSPDATGIDEAIRQAMAGFAATTPPALYASAPVARSLIVLGYGAVTGWSAGAISGIRLNECLFAGLLKDSLKAGYHGVLLLAANHKARQHAEAVLSATLSGPAAQT